MFTKIKTLGSWILFIVSFAFLFSCDGSDPQWTAENQSSTPLDPDSVLTIVETFVYPDINPVGIAFGGNRIYVTNSYNLDDNYPAGDILQFDTSMHFIDSISPEIPATGSIAFDNDNLWVSNASQLVKLNMSGNVVDTFDSGDTIGDLAFDGTYLWSATRDAIYKIDVSNNSIKAYSYPFTVESLGVGIAYAGGSSLWIAVNDDIYKFVYDTSHGLYQSREFYQLPGFGVYSPMSSLAFDGEYFWFTGWGIGGGHIFQLKIEK